MRLIVSSGFTSTSADLSPSGMMTVWFLLLQGGNLVVVIGGIVDVARPKKWVQL